MLAIDGIVFSLQRYGGISVYFLELIKYLSKNEELFRLILERPILKLMLIIRKIIRQESLSDIVLAVFHPILPCSILVIFENPIKPAQYLLSLFTILYTRILCQDQANGFI